MKRLLFALLAFHLSLFASDAQTAVSHYLPGITAEGAVYFLPKTAIRVTVQVEKTSYTPGDLCAYAERFLRIKDVPSQPYVNYRITSIRQSFFAVADTTKGYAVKFDARTSASNILLSDDGVLLAINATERKAESGKWKENGSSTGNNHSPHSHIQQLDPHQYLSEEILAAGSKAKMAELTAQDIYEIRESRNLLVRGQADYMPKDGEQLRLMLSQLEQQDKAMSSMFTGVLQRDTTEHEIVFVPSEDSSQKIIFRFSQKLGLVDDDDLAGTPYYIKVDNLRSIPQEPVADLKKKNKQEPGIYVNVPGRLRSTILNGRMEAVLSAESPAGQFGNVELLSGALFNKRYTTHLWLNPISGAVEKLEAEMPK